MFTSTMWWSQRFVVDEASTAAPSDLTPAQPNRRNTYSIGKVFRRDTFRVTRATLTHIVGPVDLATLVVLRWSPYPVPGRSMRPRRDARIVGAPCQD